MLTEAEEALIVEFPRRALLPLDELLGCLREPIPSLSRSALQRCLQRHGISRLARGSSAPPMCCRFADTPLGYVHLDSCEVRSAEGKRHLFLAIDRMTKFVYVEFHSQATMAAGATFLQNVIRVFPYQIHTVLTDSGTAFADQPRYRHGPTATLLGGHPFDRVCRAHGITHKLTRPYHPWTNGEAERMNRRRLQRSRPWGGLLQANATTCASWAPCSLRWYSRRDARRSSVAASPCSTYCRRTRAMVGWLTSTASAMAWSTQAGPSGPWSALSRMRACVSLRLGALPAVSRCST